MRPPNNALQRTPAASPPSPLSFRTLGDAKFRLRWLTGATLLLAFASGCYSVRATKKNLVGRYEITHNFGREVLTLRADGKFEQVFLGATGKRQENVGRWDIRAARLTESSVATGSVVHLDSAIMFSDPFGNLAADLHPSRWDLDIQMVWGRMELEFSPDLPGFRRVA